MVSPERFYGLHRDGDRVWPLIERKNRLVVEPRHELIVRVIYVYFGVHGTGVVCHIVGESHYLASEVFV